MIIRVLSDGPGTTTGTLSWGDVTVACALGRGGVAPAAQKREGDGITPIGTWPLRRVFFRADRVPTPATGLPCRAIAPEDGWCDDAGDPAYNRLVRLPFAPSHEEMWRDDEVYDVVVELGYNDDPPVPGRGSAIFLHLARPGYAPTEGCVAIARDALIDLLAACGPGTMIRIEG